MKITRYSLDQLMQEAQEAKESNNAEFLYSKLKMLTEELQPHCWRFWRDQAPPVGSKVMVAVESNIVKKEGPERVILCTVSGARDYVDESGRVIGSIPDYPFWKPYPTGPYED